MKPELKPVFGPKADRMQGAKKNCNRSILPYVRIVHFCVTSQVGDFWFKHHIGRVKHDRKTPVANHQRV